MNEEKIFEPLKDNYEKVQDLGFIEPKIDLEKDYFFLGATKIPNNIINESGQWLDVLIGKEYQKKNGVETMGCSGFGTNNGAEMLIKFLYKEDWNGSDRAINILANNTPNGNSPQRPAEVLRKIGVCSEELLPFENINTWNEFHSPKPLPQNILQECIKFKDKWEFSHEWVPTTQRRLVEALKRSPLGISVCAWKYRNGMYWKNPGERDNHWCLLIGYEYGKCWYIFDSYDSFVKKLEWNYSFKYAKRYYIKKQDSYKEEQLINKDMIKTGKFETDARIFLISNENPKDLLHIKDEPTWNTFKKMNFITDEPNEIWLDTDFENYNILPQEVDTPIKVDVTTNPFIRALKKIFGIK